MTIDRQQAIDPISRGDGARRRRRGDRTLQALVAVRDDQLHAFQAAADEVLEEARPEGLGLGRTDVQADDLAPPVGVGCHSDYRRDRDDAPPLADLQVGGIEPEIGPISFQRSLQEGADAFVDLLAQLGDLALADPGQAHGLHQIVDLARRDTGNPRLLDHRDQRFLGRLAGFEKGRQGAPGPQFRDERVQLPEPGVACPVRVAVAPSRTLAAPLVAAGTDQALHVRLHEDLQHCLGEAAKKTAIIGLLQRRHQRHPVVGHQGRSGRR